MTRILMIGIHARALDYSKLPPGLDEATMTERIEAGFGATTAAGFADRHLPGRGRSRDSLGVRS
ncbi:hypothetical protein [[Micrococcus luteus] ATCC 49442]|uniref:hypothetical protein n=1 Tax=[Micrococcus luteus] ATCC 49442 TaxID=2698727 RepID=UPI001AD6F2B9|nr:hypothetical protein [[Micrococcus luteus] ATCC 49442]